MKKLFLLKRIKNLLKKGLKMRVKETILPEKGPLIYENWKKAKEGTPVKGIYEYPLFTDAGITGELLEDACPYKLLNPVRIDINQVDVPGIILRAEEYLDDNNEFTKELKTDTKHYHGGNLCDEIAALISICLGIRLKAGGVTREFKPGGDPKGYPRIYEISRNPILIKPAMSLPVLPSLLEPQAIDKTIFNRFLDLSPKDANVIVHTARLYQDAVWVAESEPEFSWLMLVSAIETAANYWRSSKESPTDRLTESKPDLVKLLIDYGGDELVSKVANYIADHLGATKKFIDFVLEFAPDPPRHRPPQAFQLSWDKKNLKNSLRIIYGWRSRALHGGTPFPAPMCQAPRFIEKGGVLIEIPLGLATHSQGATWVKKDTPMLLHIFEYIVRQALLKWWKSMLPSKHTNNCF